ncbi:hypothetical protein L4C54_11015 [Vibrio lamellibrachiae]|uniref:hypothetical protein n=1 Tax=Vibrio lamellibrachiae TaxID=2910253 RepID=UPI003D144229
MMISETEQLQKSSSLAQWWKGLAYRHKWAESLLYIMFVSGVLLWQRIELAWALERWMLLIHMMVGVSIFSIVIGAFWSSHRSLIQNSNKPFLRKTGTIIEWLLVLCCLSGFFLFFFGKTGNTLSVIIQDIHFYSSWFLAPLVFRHAMRWSVLKVFSTRRVSK